MYFLISTGAIASVISWYLASYSFFMISVATTIIIATYTGFLVYNKDTFIHQCVFCMTKTECCCVHKLWSDPKSVIWSTNFIKTTAGILAAVAIQNSWQYAKAFKDGSYITVTLLWILTVVLWVFIKCTHIHMSHTMCRHRWQKTTQSHSCCGYNINHGTKNYSR